MFFGTKEYVAKGFDDTIQVWKTTKDIDLIFLVEFIANNGWVISALPRLFNSVFPEDIDAEYNDLDIKHRDINRRNKLINELFIAHKIQGWLTSLEGRIDIEVCLFDKNTNTKQLKLIETVKEKNEKYLKDSLQKIKIYPSSTFFAKTEEKLNGHNSYTSNRQNSYKQYRRFINASIKEYVALGMTKNLAKHYMFDLRTKLKI